MRYSCRTTCHCCRGRTSLGQGVQYPFFWDFCQEWYQRRKGFYYNCYRCKESIDCWWWSWRTKWWTEADKCSCYCSKERRMLLSAQFNSIVSYSSKSPHLSSFHYSPDSMKDIMLMCKSVSTVFPLHTPLVDLVAFHIVLQRSARFALPTLLC